ncbi:hypothetical protein KUTeg_005643 [Tegillarca granosa]|uniref:Uncharacterized protein n=1 Tax=Tegillarca granosa TaxID=220873 RepID=A0ABQ9FKC4_TEGGR|nr:hypothetical protein KUTeg_005643 [Tegillarca granosa]
MSVWKVFIYNKCVESVMKMSEFYNLMQYSICFCYNKLASGLYKNMANLIFKSQKAAKKSQYCCIYTKDWQICLNLKKSIIKEYLYFELILLTGYRLYI